MNRSTRPIAALTMMVAAGVFAAPLHALESESATTEQKICEALGPLRDTLGTAVQAATAAVAAREDAVNDAADDLDESSTALGTTGLAYIRALDGTGNERTTLNAYQAAAAQFSQDVVAFVDSVEDFRAALNDVGMKNAVLRYYAGLCPAPTPSPTLSASPSVSPTPSVSPSPSVSPTPSLGGLGSLLSNLLGGLFGQP